MKTFHQFQEDMTFAVENLMFEAKGFKDAVKRRRKKKSSFLSPRERKIKDLKDRPMSWQGLE